MCDDKGGNHSKYGVCVDTGPRARAAALFGVW